MSAARRLGRIVRFAAVGLSATALYALLAALFTRADVAGPVAASVMAYLLAAAFSYLGHKFVTFVTAGQYRSELPRFMATTFAGFAVAAAAPTVLTSLLGFPAWVAIAFTCIVIPVANLVILDRWVFATAR